MKNTISSFVKEFIKVVVIVAVAVPTIALFAAWTGPTGVPPTNNADAPVNVGHLDQIKAYETDGLGNLISGKSGGLGVGTFFSRFTTLLAKDGGNVGIGQRDWLANPPTEKLEVEGGVKIIDGTQGAGKVLTSDMNGLASWRTPAGSGLKVKGECTINVWYETDQTCTVPGAVFMVLAGMQIWEDGDHDSDARCFIDNQGSSSVQGRLIADSDMGRLICTFLGFGR